MKRARPRTLWSQGNTNQQTGAIHLLLQKIAGNVKYAVYVMKDPKPNVLLVKLFAQELKAQILQVLQKRAQMGLSVLPVLLLVHQNLQTKRQLLQLEDSHLGHLHQQLRLLSRPGFHLQLQQQGRLPQ